MVQENTRGTEVVMRIKDFIALLFIFICIITIFTIIGESYVTDGYNATNVIVGFPIIALTTFVIIYFLYKETPKFLEDKTYLHNLTGNEMRRIYDNLKKLPINTKIKGNVSFFINLEMSNWSDGYRDNPVKYKFTIFAYYNGMEFWQTMPFQYLRDRNSLVKDSYGHLSTLYNEIVNSIILYEQNSNSSSKL